MSLPALSIRQPWAWLIVNGHKDIENRTWRANFRGRILVHAGKGMTRDEWAGALATVEAVNETTGSSIVLPLPDELQRGGIGGEVEITGCTDDSTSPWFFGPFGFRLANAKTLPFRPCKGALGFFTPEFPPQEPDLFST